jgi:hypothetical protein
MYDEFERAVTGPPRRGRSRLGWLAVGLITFLAVGVGGSMWAYHVVRSRVLELSERITPAMEVSRAFSTAVAQAFAALEPGHLASDPNVAEDFLSALQSGALDGPAMEDVVEGFFRLRTEEGDVTADLHGNEGGGRLLIRSPEGEVRLDLVRDEDGGELVVRTDEQVLRIGSGGSAHDLPDWIPRMDGIRDDPREILSASSEQGRFGIVTWEADADGADLVAAYRRRLESMGYEVRAEHDLRHEDGRTASVTGVEEATGRVVFLATAREEGVTRVILGYGQGEVR